MEQIKQYYVFEIQKYEDGTYGHIVHFAYDDDPSRARLKAESKYHEILAAAAISQIPQHSASLLLSDGRMITSQCYIHPAATEVVEDDNTGE